MWSNKIISCSAIIATGGTFRVLLTSKHSNWQDYYFNEFKLRIFALLSPDFQLFFIFFIPQNYALQQHESLALNWWFVSRISLIVFALNHFIFHIFFHLSWTLFGFPRFFPHPTNCGFLTHREIRVHAWMYPQRWLSILTYCYTKIEYLIHWLTGKSENFHWIFYPPLTLGYGLNFGSAFINSDPFDSHSFSRLAFVEIKEIKGKFKKLLLNIIFIFYNPRLKL